MMPLTDWPRSTIAILGALLATGCLDIDFEPPHLVQTPRILAIHADPPESEFGADVTFAALVVDADGSDLALEPDVELRWTVCLSVAEVINASGLGFGLGLQDTCDEGGDDLARLETEGLAPNEARLPGAAFFRLATMLPMGGETPPSGEAIDPMLLETLMVVLTEVGVPLRVRLEVWRGEERILTGFKRFAVTTRAAPTTNPPPPRFAIDGVWLSARLDPASPWICEPEAGARPRVAPEAEVEVTPDPDEEAWIEQYPVFDLQGELEINSESAYYSWFSTAGAFEHDVTRRPERDNAWTAPEAPGDYPMWVVVRDGHLGIVWCRAEVEVR